MIGLPASFPSGIESLTTVMRRPWTALQAGAAVLVIALIDVFVRGHSTMIVHGVSDEIGHLLTGLLFATVLMLPGVPLSLAWALVGSVIIDLDHIPWLVSWIDQPDHLSRSVTHSFAIVVLIAGIGLFDRGRWLTWWSLAFGIFLHLVRDLATGNVRFWWPLSDDIHWISYYAYAFALGMAGSIIVAASLVCPSRVPSLQLERIWSMLSRFNLKYGPRKDT